MYHDFNAKVTGGLGKENTGVTSRLFFYPAMAILLRGATYFLHLSSRVEILAAIILSAHRHFYDGLSLSAKSHSSRYPLKGMSYDRMDFIAYDVLSLETIPTPDIPSHPNPTCLVIPVTCTTRLSHEHAITV